MKNIKGRGTDIAKNNTEGNDHTRESELLNVRIHEVYKLLGEKRGMIPAAMKELIVRFVNFAAAAINNAIVNYILYCECRMANKHATAFLFYLEPCFIGVYQNEKDFLRMIKPIKMIGFIILI